MSVRLPDTTPPLAMVSSSTVSDMITTSAGSLASVCRTKPMGPNSMTTLLPDSFS